MSYKLLRRLVTFFLTLAISFADLDSALAAAGALDPTFDVDGKVITPIASGAGDDHGYATAVQPDGRIIVAGLSDQGISSADFALARYNSDGSLDTTFDTDGKVTTDFGNNAVDIARAVALQTDGKIVVAGLSDQVIGTAFALARYNSDGSLDTTFDTDGKVITSIGSGGSSGDAIVVQPDSKIVVTGSGFNGTNADFALIRYNSDGSLDTTFDTDGKVTTDFGGSDAGRAMVLQPDGKIIVAGNSDISSNVDFALARYNSDGSLDTTFDTDGKVTTDFGGGPDRGSGIALQSDGKIVVAGESTSGTNDDFALARYNSDGSLDTTFDTDGKVTTDFGSSEHSGGLALQPDGKIVIAGDSFSAISNADFALARYNNDGSLDTTFDTDGKVTTDFGSNQLDGARAIALQADGKIVAAGTSPQSGTDFDFAVARYDAGISTVLVTIDIKPGRFPNRIELEKNVCKDDDNLHVAILTTPTFDALTVDITSIKLGDPLLGGTAVPVHSRTRDVDLDGDLDLVLAFTLCDLVTNMALDLSSTELGLSGTTIDGTSITGSDSVKVVREDDD